MDSTETAAGTLPVGVRDAAAAPLPSCASAAGTAAVAIEPAASQAARERKTKRRRRA